MFTNSLNFKMWEFTLYVFHTNLQKLSQYVFYVKKKKLDISGVDYGFKKKVTFESLPC